MSEVKVKKVELFYSKYNKLNRYFDYITGYGPAFITLSGLIRTEIENPTGLQPAIYYKTGLLTGLIQEGGSFTWEDVTLTGLGEQGMVYFDYITGQKQASGIIEFNDNLLTDGDYVNINSTRFTYRLNGTNLRDFNSSQELLNKLNSGATGGYLNIDNNLFNLGITGYKENNSLILFAYKNSGALGNETLMFRDCTNLDAIKIPNRYFKGGEDLRPLINQWVGKFENTFDIITVENSGIYTNSIFIPNVTNNISGLIWINNFDNYNISSGFKDPRNPGNYSGVKLNYNPNLNIYSGRFVFSTNQTKVPQRFNIDINRSNPFNVGNNIIKYTINGDDILLTGLLEG